MSIEVTPLARPTRSSLLFRMRWNRIWKLIAAMGMPAATRCLLDRKGGLRRSSEYWIHPRGISRSLCVRRDSSDLEVFFQIFVDREYGCLDDLQDVRLIIDCGANVGYSSAYLLSQHPQSTVVAVEPDAGNFAMMERNLAPFGSRVKLVRAGVWSKAAPLVISDVPFRDGREWTKQVRVCRPGEPADFQGIDVGSLLAQSGHERISLLKMDVEGAEAVIFSENYHSWLDKVDAIAIELHDDSMFGNGPRVFAAAIAGHGFRMSYSGDLTICRRFAPTGLNDSRLTGGPT